MTKPLKYLFVLFTYFLSTTVFAYDFEVDGIYYNVNFGNAVVTYRNANDNTYTGDLVIPEAVVYNNTVYPVTSIGMYAFQYDTGLTSVTMPNSIIAIGDQAFFGCTKLADIVIPNSVKSIGNNAFDNTAWFKNRPNGLVYAGLVAYKYKGSMPSGTTITIEEGTISIAGSAFRDCSGLFDITIPNSVATIGSGAFYNTSWLNRQPEGVVYAGLVAYCYKGEMPTGTNIMIENGTKSISNSAFSGCNGLANIIIPNSVIDIGENAFFNCKKLTSISIPNSIKLINNAVFSGCRSLTNVSIPESVEIIGNQAFSDCSALINITFPHSLKYIGNNTFSNCSSLSDIKIPNSVVSIGQQAFAHCNALTNIVIPNSLTQISDYMFYSCTNITKVQIPNSITAIGSRAFYDCSNLTSINFPNTITSIGGYAFYNCANLKRLVIPNSVTLIGDCAFSNCSSISFISLGTSVNKVGYRAFYNCVSLRSLNICGNIESIGNELFSRTQNLYLFIKNGVNCIPSLGLSPISIYCYNTTPPQCQDGTFSSYSGTLHIPSSSVASYFTAPIWENFNNIANDAVEPSDIFISSEDIEIQIGEEMAINAYVIPSEATPNSITWNSSDESIAQIIGDKLIGLAVGECYITANCLDIQRVCHVVVKETQITITLNEHEILLLPNQIITLIPTVTPIETELMVTSSDATIAATRIFNNREVQVVGIKEGTTTITVGSVDGTAIPATCFVTVYTEPGDMNCDGFVNISDVTDLIDYLLNGDSSQISTKNADVDQDGNISISDVTELIDILLQGNG